MKSIYETQAAETARLHAIQVAQMPRCGQMWKPTYGHAVRVHCAITSRRMFIATLEREDGTYAASLYTDGGINCSGLITTSARGESIKSLVRRFIASVRATTTFLD